MTTLDEDTRHAERNEQAKRRAVEQLRPVFPALLASLLEVKEEEIPAVRDAIKDMMKSRKLREDRKNKTISDLLSEAVKWLVGVALGALGLWASLHQGGSK